MLQDEEDSDTAIAARLLRVREIFDMNKKDFGARAGISEQAYGAFENAQRSLTLVAAKKLRKTYGLSLEFMYFGKIDDLPTRISKEL